MDISISGVAEFEANLQKLAQALDKEQLLEIVQEGADIIRDAAAENAPVGETGNLKAGMTTAIGHERIGDVIINVGPDAKQFYGRFVELGTIHMGPHPFLKPALERNRDRVAALMQQRMLEAIAKNIKSIDERQAEMKARMTGNR